MTFAPRVLLVNATITSAHHARFPLAVLNLSAALEGKYTPAIIDGNVDRDFVANAVRAAGAAGLRTPFTSALSGQDFVRLITAGWVPAGLVLGIDMGSRHDDWATTRQTRPWAGNVEMAGWTALVNQTRQEAGRRLAQDVRRLGAEGVVTADMRMRVRERDCPAVVGRRDHVVEVTLIGTAIASFADAAHRHTGPGLAIMRLDQQRSQAIWP